MRPAGEESEIIEVLQLARLVSMVFVRFRLEYNAALIRNSADERNAVLQELLPRQNAQGGRFFGLFSHLILLGYFCGKCTPDAVCSQ